MGRANHPAAKARLSASGVAQLFKEWTDDLRKKATGKLWLTH
ncbi:MAG TPA: hypothetical protein VK140_01405 [Ktedonobacteraceae bacterium]|nr:hypothetical protein [Ktedonobacteraceae bacterium]